MKLNVAQVTHKAQKLKLTPSRNNLLIPSLGVFLTCFLLSFISSSLIIQPQGTKAVTGLSLVASPTMTLNTSSNNISMQITPTSTGTFAANSHTLTATTNVPTGYQLSIATTAAPTLPVTSGTFASPSTLSSNTWGYSLTGSTDSSIWAGATTTPTTIKNTTASTAGDNTTIYYGAKADMNLVSGTYTNTVQYTATANIASIPTPTIASVSPSSGTTAGGTSIAIIGTGFTVNDQSVTTAITIGGQACTSVSISSNTPTTGQDTITCDTPVHAAGTADITVTNWANTSTLANGFTYTAPIPTITSPTANQIFSAGTTSTTLSVATSMNAICYYGSSSSPTAPMATTGGTSHSQSITGLTNNSTNTRYVRCQAASGQNYGTETSVTFYVKAAMPTTPTAYRPANGSMLGASLNRVNNVAATVAAGVTCTYTTNRGAITGGDDVTGLAAGNTTLSYSCTAGSGNTLSEARTGSWSFSIDTSVISTGTVVQTVALARPTQCPAVRTRVQDARDTATYWIGRVDGYTRGLENTETTYDAANPPTTGRCWMQTNLAYGGGGTNTYGDVKNITNGDGIVASNDYFKPTTPYYFIPPGSNRTAGTTDPSTSTTGEGQYGYLYNWCAAMGAQTATSACANATTPVPNTNISICPKGWRLPTGNAGEELQQMMDNIRVTDDAAGSATLRTNWLGMYSGAWGSGASHNQELYGYIWSASQYNATDTYYLNFTNHSAARYSDGKYFGFAVRCVTS